MFDVLRYGDGANLSRRSSTSSISSLTGVSTVFNIIVALWVSLEHSRFIKRLLVILDSVDWTQQTPKFVHDTSKMWYKPNITRDES
jgi:hypothetical protein